MPTMLRNLLPLLILLPATTVLAAETTVYNRAIYRLQDGRGHTVGIKALAGLTLTGQETRGGEAVPTFLVKGKRMRVSDSDLARIRERKEAGLLPADFSWYYQSDPRTLHPSWDPKVFDAIADRVITQGMTEEQVLMAFGAPDRKNINKRPENIQEQWIYSTGSIWFVEGKVFSWQAPR